MKWIKISKDLEITNEQMYNGLIYKKILELLKEDEQIADYHLLQKLRNTGKYDFLKDFWVFVPNPDKISENKGYVAWFSAYSVRADFDCGRDPDDSVASLGVFLIRKKRNDSNT